MAANYVLLERIELNANASAVEFTNIPQSGYTDLKIVTSTRSTNASQATDLRFTLNGNGSSIYSLRGLYGYSGGAGSFAQTNAFGLIGQIPAASSTSSTFESSELYIPNYLTSNNKSYSIDNAWENNSSTNWQLNMFAGLFASTTAISSIYLYPAAGSFVQYSTFSLYGLAAVGTTPAIAPKASGGNITTDGTYWYHTFLTSGTFTPATNLTCDYLVVAGGGGGGGAAGTGGGAGGGAGGVRSTVTSTGGGGSLESALSLIPNSYTVTIGAGGTGSSASTTNGTSGSNSVFATITSTGGGRGATCFSSIVGQNGGSGGGGGSAGTPNHLGGSASPSGQGYAGGYGDSTGYGGAGGGGGAGAAGGNAYGSYPTPQPQGSGAGGNGIYTALTNAVAAGQLSSSNYYVGGGGGGGFNTTGGIAGGGGTGGGGAGSSNAGASGTANTGGGAAGGGYNGSTNLAGGNGGSGIVIIRYAMV